MTAAPDGAAVTANGASGVTDETAGAASKVLSHTRSLCPVCLKSLPAQIRVTDLGRALLERTCPEHGFFSQSIWQGPPDIRAWSRPKKPSANVRRETESHLGCPHDCGRCPEHGQHACTVLFEITSACNLHCPVCFADAGGGGPAGGGPADAPSAGVVPPDEASAGGRDRLLERDWPLERVKTSLAWIREHAGEVVLQLSGGEPTLHPHLPDIVREAAALFPAVQLNTNGLLLAERPELAAALAKAGLNWVFLQCDGTTDDIFVALRGRALLEKKLAAVENCRKAGLSVVLVPTVARGINDHDLGNLLRLALVLTPTVRGLHLQPMTASGRNALAKGRQPLTLPEVLCLIAGQSNGLIRPEHAAPPGCEHERCSFHCRYRLTPSGGLVPLRDSGDCCPRPEPVLSVPGGRADNRALADNACCRAGQEGRKGPEEGETGAKRAIDVILRAWQGPHAVTGAATAATGGAPAATAAPDAFDAFIAEAKARTFSVTCMAFQDAASVDLERLKGCCVHVYAPPHRLIPFCAYNLTALDGRPLHRGRN